MLASLFARANVGTVEAVSTACVILTYCQAADALYGSLLTFDTFRIGFPDAELHVVDNGSIPEVRAKIRTRALECGGRFQQLETPIPHHQFIRWAINNTSPGKSLVLLDPDIIFWDKIPLSSRALLAGRRIPPFDDPFSKAQTFARLHTSLLMIPDPVRLREEIECVEREWFELDAIAPTMVPMLGRGVMRYDTFGVFYALRAEMCSAFSTEMLDCYDHIFCGTHLRVIAERMPDPSVLTNAHELAKTNPASLKGLWRIQEAYFQSRLLAL